MSWHPVVVVESGNGRFGQFITAGHHVLGADEPEGADGNDTGPDPFALVLAGLGACTVMTIMYADRKLMPLEKIEVRLRRLQPATAGQESRHRLERVIILRGKLTSDQRGRLLEIAEHCPVSRMLDHGAEIVSVIEDKAPSWLIVRARNRAASRYCSSITA